MSGAEQTPGDLDADLLDPRRLLILGTVARCGSLAKAAHALHWTQPAVAQHIKHLERDAGCALVVRTPRGVLLTDAGAALAEHANAIAGRLRAAREDLTALSELRAGRVRLAAFPSACATFVPPVLAQLMLGAPGLDIRLIEAEPPQARQLLAAGEVDLAVSFDYDNLPGHAPAPRSHLFNDPLLLVLPPEHPLADRSAVDLADAASEQWIAGCPRCRAHLLAAAATRGFAPDIRHSTDDYVVTQTLVANGLGVALLPALALAASRDARVQTAPVARLAPRRVYLQTPTEMPLSPATHALVEILRDVVKDNRKWGALGNVA